MSWKPNFRNHISHAVTIPKDGTIPTSVTWMDHPSREKGSAKVAIFEVDSENRPYCVGVRKTTGTSFSFLNTQQISNGEQVAIRIPNDQGEAFAFLASDPSVYLHLRLVEVVSARLVAGKVTIL
jgi:hypothetical protein